MILRYFLDIALFGALFWSKEVSSVSDKVLTYSTEIMCALAANSDPNIPGYFFKELEAFLQDEDNGNYAGNCILLAKVDSNPITHQTLIPHGFIFRVLVTSGDVAYTHDMSLPSYFDKEAIEAGFDHTIVVGNKTFYMKEMTFNSNYSHAMIECLQFGGILPMEQTDEFVDQMSILSGDSSTSRFISLAYESTTAYADKYLMWTTGLKEWQEGESLAECPRCQNWAFGNGAANLWAKINPTTKLYEVVVPSEIVPKFYCQYLGGNLATNQIAVGSSVIAAPNQPNLAVDGIASNTLDLWHSDKVVPGGEWFSVDLGEIYVITNVLFLARLDYFSYRHNKMQVWIDGPEPLSGNSLDTSERVLCGIYQFYQRDSQLSGVACQSPTIGRRVTILNPADEVTHFVEVAVHGILK